ncbi:hypothetical protein DY000_02017171 [Brassica cretica]|uniref:X8 domain-containing protein n=1 Tax=Brassica cretica TaxID=69181 RepID=A0ABQ7CKV6_BRACR|nr:hypothetical protein DY000_02017171 [Brassica cretica]
MKETASASSKEETEREIVERSYRNCVFWCGSCHDCRERDFADFNLLSQYQQDDSTRRLHNSIYTWIATIPRRHVHCGDLIVTVRPWWYVHDDVYGDLFLAISRLTLHPWQLAPVVQNTVFTDRSQNHPGVRGLIGIRSMSMTTCLRRSRSIWSFLLSWMDKSRLVSSNHEPRRCGELTKFICVFSLVMLLDGRGHIGISVFMHLNARYVLLLNQMKVPGDSCGESAVDVPMHYEFKGSFDTQAHVVLIDVGRCWLMSWYDDHYSAFYGSKCLMRFNFGWVAFCYQRRGCMVLVRRLNTEQVFMILTFAAGGDQGYRYWLLMSPVMHAALLPNAVFVKVYKTWCVANGKTTKEKLQEGLDYACGEGGADCRPIQKGATCYDPESLEAHASYAFNSYYQKNARGVGTCDFGGAAYVSTGNASFQQGTEMGMEEEEEEEEDPAD